MLKKSISVKILQRNINGKRPGSTAVKNSFSPLVTLCAYREGLTKIRIITTIIIIDNNAELKEVQDAKAALEEDLKNNYITI